MTSEVTHHSSDLVDVPVDTLLGKDKVGTYESLLERTGGFGRYQWLILIPYALSQWIFALLILFMVFGAVFPVDECTLQNSTLLQFNQTLNETCEQHYSFHSLVAEWNLNTPTLKYVPSIINTVTSFGLLVGPTVSGIISDRFGRRKTLIVIFSMTTCLVTLRGFSNSWQMFAGLTFLLGCFGGAMSGCCFVYFMEHCVARRRILFALTGWTPGCLIFGLIALVTRDWRTMNFTILAFLLPALIILLVTKQSPKWCIARRNKKLARNIFAHIAHFNGKDDFDAKDFDIAFDAVVNEATRDLNSTKTYSYWHLFYSKRATTQGIAIMAGWGNAAIVLYGITFGMAALAGDIYLNYLITSFVVYVACVTISTLDFKFDWLGRRRIILLLLGAELVCLIFATLAYATSFYSSHPHLVTAIALLGSVFCQMVWIFLEIILAEFYPTEIRTLGYSANNFVARVTMILAPQIMPLRDIWLPLPFLVLTGTTTLLFIFQWFHFPETKNCDLPDLPEEEPLAWCRNND